MPEAVLATAQQQANGSPAARVQLRLLLLAGPCGDVTTAAWRQALRRFGVPFDEVTVSAARPLRERDLLDPGDVTVGRYGGVVLGTDSSAYWGALEALGDYRRRFGVRLVRGYELPRPGVGLADGTGEDLGGQTARLTAGGREVFGYLRADVPLDPGSYGYRGRPLAGSAVTPLVEDGDGNVLVGLHRADGLEDLVCTVNYSDVMLHWRLLVRGLLTWVTRGVHLGLARHVLSVHVDDVLLASASVADGESAPDVAPPTVRMTPADVAALVRWQEETGFAVDLAYNGAGAGADDDLTRALLDAGGAFRWLNHTWSHRDLDAEGDGASDGRPQVGEIVDEVLANLDWARTAGLDVDPRAVVTGAHSGLDNPNLPAALATAGVDVLADDASVHPEQRRVGPALTAPRHPVELSTHVSRWSQQLEEDRRRRGPAAAADVEEYVAEQARALLARALGGDPRPSFAHQANVTGDRPLLALLGSALQRYDEYVTAGCPLERPSLSEAAAELRRRDRWRDAVTAGQVEAYAGGRRVEVRCAVEVEVPLTVPRTAVRLSGARPEPFGAEYAGACSAWYRVPAGGRLLVVVPAAAAPGAGDRPGAAQARPRAGENDHVAREGHDAAPARGGRR